MSYSLSRSAISELSQISEPKKELSVDYNLQVHFVKETENRGKKTDIISLTLADEVEKYSGFIYMNTEKKNIQIGDIVNISKIMASQIKTNQRVYVIRKMEIIGHSTKFLSNPEASKMKNKPPNEDIVQNEEKMKINDERPKNSSHQYRDEYDFSKCSPLAQLTTFSKSVVVFVKVESKSELKAYTNKKTGAESHLFNLNVIDSEGTELPVSAFSEAAQKFYDLLVKDHFYVFEDCKVKINEKRFSTIKSDYKLILDSYSNVIEMKTTFDAKCIVELVTLNNMNILENNTFIDVLGSIIEIGPTDEITLKKTNTQKKIKRLKIGDESQTSVSLTLWENLCDIPFSVGDIFLFRKVKVGTYLGEKTLSTTMDSSLEKDPKNLPQYLKFAELIHKGNVDWKENERDMSVTTSNEGAVVNEVSFLKEIINNENLSEDDKKNPVTKFKGTIKNIFHGERQYYVGCPDCKKKVYQEGENYHCEKCNKDVEPTVYYSASMCACDATGEYYISIFGDIAEKLFGIPAKEYKEIIDNNDQVRLNDISQKIEFNQFIFTGKTKFHSYNGNISRRFHTYKVEKLENKRNEAKRLIDNIKNILGIKLKANK